MEPVAAERQTELIEPFVTAMEEPLDIPDNVFLNSQGVPPPPDKRRSSVLEYEQKLEEKIYAAKTDKYKVRKALTKCDDSNILLSLVRSINNMNNSINDLKRDVSSMKRDLTDVKRDLTDVKKDVNDMKPLMLMVRVSENIRRRKLGTNQIPIPFLVEEGPNVTDLPAILSIEDINRLSVDQLQRYLRGYNIEFSTRFSRKRMKMLLRDTLGYCTPVDLTFEFS